MTDLEQVHTKGPRGCLEAVILDYGGVLADEGFLDGMAAIASANGLQPAAVQQAGVDAIHRSGYVTGRGTEQAFWSLFRSNTGISWDDERLRQEILSRFVLRPGVLACVRDLRRRGIHTAILSDQTDWLDELDARDGFFEDFDHVFNSYRLGKTKRDASTFDHVLLELGVGPAETIFVDDKLNHVQRARSRGMLGIVYRDEASLVRTLNAMARTRPSTGR